MTLQPCECLDLLRPDRSLVSQEPDMDEETRKTLIKAKAGEFFESLSGKDQTYFLKNFNEIIGDFSLSEQRVMSDKTPKPRGIPRKDGKPPIQRKRPELNPPDIELPLPKPDHNKKSPDFIPLKHSSEKLSISSKEIAAALNRIAANNPKNIMNEVERQKTEREQHIKNQREEHYENRRKNQRNYNRKHNAHYKNYLENEEHHFPLYLSGLVHCLADQKSNFGRPRTKLTDYLFAMIYTVYSQKSSRRSMGLLRYMINEGYLTHIPASNSTTRFLADGKTEEILRVLHAISATAVSHLEATMMIDSSGFQTTSFNDWFSEKHHVRKEHEWLKMHACVGLNTRIIAAVTVTNKNSHDNTQFKPLIDEVMKHFDVTEVMADKAYDARANYKLTSKYNIRLLVPFRRMDTANSKGVSEWTDAYLFMKENREEFDALYHRRSNVESTFHSIKSQLGEHIRSKKPEAQKNELYCKAIAYNIKTLIRLRYMNDIVPNFVDEEELEEM